jgi:AcrR family transcriptional regulator
MAVTTSLTDDDAPPSKQAIVAAALKLFVRDGYKETTIRAIADEAGYTNPALFKFFATKDDLGAYLFLRCHAAFVSKIDAHMRNDGPLGTVMSTWVGAFLELLAESRETVLFVHEHAGTFAPRVAKQLDGDPFARLHGWLRRARAGGRVSTAVPERLQGILIIGTLHQLARTIDVAALRVAERNKLISATTQLLVGALQP